LEPSVKGGYNVRDAFNNIPAIARIFDVGEAGEAEANGRLIVLAPDMYEALKVAHSSLRTFSPEVPQDRQGWTSYDEDARALIESVLEKISGGV
jgi:hypothetical protein